MAGNGSYGYSGDGGPAINAQLKGAFGVAVDKTGNVFIADEQNSRIRKVTSAGIITTVAGNGTKGYSGDGGPATNAQLDGPWGVAVDTAGNLFIADAYNNRIRKVSSRGIITTVAGVGTEGYSGDGGPAFKAQLQAPYGVAVDTAGNLFIADTGNNRIRRVSSTGTTTTVVGVGTDGYSGDGGPATDASLGSAPYAVAVDSAGNLFIADRNNNRIRRVSSGGSITTVAGVGTGGYSGDGGRATVARLKFPGAVAVDSTGNVYVSDSGNNAIRLLQLSGR